MPYFLIVLISSAFSLAHADSASWELSYKLKLEKKIIDNIGPMAFSCKNKLGFQETFNTWPLKITLDLEKSGKCLKVDFKKHVRHDWKHCIEKKLCDLNYDKRPKQVEKGSFNLTIFKPK